MCLNRIRGRTESRGGGVCEDAAFRLNSTFADKYRKDKGIFGQYAMVIYFTMQWDKKNPIP